MSNFELTTVIQCGFLSKDESSVTPSTSKANTAPSRTSELGGLSECIEQNYHIDEFTTAAVPKQRSQATLSRRS